MTKQVLTTVLGLVFVVASNAFAGGFDQHLDCYNAIARADSRYFSTSIRDTSDIIASVDGKTMILPTYKDIFISNPISSRHVVQQTGFWFYTSTGAYHFKLPKPYKIDDDQNPSKHETYYFKLNLPRQRSVEYFAYKLRSNGRIARVDLGHTTSKDGYREQHFNGKPVSKLKIYELSAKTANGYSNSPMDKIRDGFPYDNYGAAYAHGRMKSYLAEVMERLVDKYSISFARTLDGPIDTQEQKQKAVLDAFQVCKKIQDDDRLYTGETLAGTADKESKVVESLAAVVANKRTK